MPDPSISSVPHAKSGETSFVHRCLTMEYNEIPDTRSWSDSPEFRRVLDPLNDRRYAVTCSEAEKLLPVYPDFDLIYVWYVSALIYQKFFDKAVLVAQDGLSKSKRKYNLCVKLGQIAWETGNIADVIYWWVQAWHCQETMPKLGGDESVFLYLYYISTELKLNNIAETLIQRVDQIRGGQIRLGVNAASSLRSLVRARGTLAIKFVLNQMAEKYLEIKSVHVEEFESTSQFETEIPWNPGQALEMPGRLEIGLIAGLIWEDERARPPLGGSWIIPCLKVEAQLYQLKMNLAQKATPNQACAFEALPTGEYLIAYNPFPVEDEENYRHHWDGKFLDFSSASALFASLSLGGATNIDLWPGPRGGTVKDQAGNLREIKANTAVGVRGNFPLVVEFLANNEPYKVQVKPAQTSHLIVRTHACSS